MPGTPDFRDTPDLRLVYRHTTLAVELDDSTTVHDIVFESIQAVRITTWDASLSVGLLPRDGIYERSESPWLEAVRGDARANDPASGFLDKSRHFLVVCYDDVLEVLAWDVSLEGSRVGLMRDEEGGMGRDRNPGAVRS